MATHGRGISNPQQCQRQEKWYRVNWVEKDMGETVRFVCRVSGLGGKNDGVARKRYKQGCSG
jgi:hypothetical protein